jgi:hypothetical protein
MATPGVFKNLSKTHDAHSAHCSLAKIELDDDDLGEIETATSKIKVQGARGTGQERYG